MSDSLLLDPDALEVVLTDDENDLLEIPAAGIRTFLPELAESLTALGLEEAVGAKIKAILGKKKFDEKLHPRWPKGTPKAGQFMRTGETFQTPDGRRWQILSTAGGRIEAADANGGKGKVEHRVFDTAADAVDGVGVAVPNVVPAAPKKLQGGATAVATPEGENTTVVSPYVEPQTHDAAIKPHAASKLDAEEWLRFGRVDQDYYNELMGRFGAWNPATAKKMMQELWSKYDADSRSVIEKALNKQYGNTGFWGSGAGQWLNLAFLFNSVKGGEGLKAAWQKYEKVKADFDEINELTHWDLYNRTKAPDITLFHGGGSGVAKYNQEFISGKEPIYAGFSQSFSLSKAEAWGSTVLATPVAIRHVSLSYFTPPIYHGNQGEGELAIGVRMKLDDRSVAFNSNGYGTHGAASQAISNWLHPETNQQPGSGALVEELKNVWAGKGSIPIPPEKPGKTPVGGQASYEKLPPEAEAEAGKLAHSLKYKSEDGSKEAAIGVLGGMGLKPGDFVEGMKGTRYVIIEDAGDDANGLRYVKVEKDGTVNYGKSYPFSASSGNQFYRLDGHIDIPKKQVAGFTPFGADDYAKLVQGEKKKLSEHKAGGYFKYDGEGFQITGPAPGMKIGAKSLDTGKEYTFNQGWETPELVAAEGFTGPTGVTTPGTAEDFATDVAELPSFEKGDVIKLGGDSVDGSVLVYFDSLTDDEPPKVKVMFSDGAKLDVFPHEIVSFESPYLAVDDIAVGDAFAHEGKKFVVTSKLKNGTVKAKPTGGKVQPFAPDHPALKSAWRPSAYVAAPDKVAVSTLEAGALVQAGQGQKVRPYMVVEPGAKKPLLVNLETGEQVTVSKQKMFALLLPAAAEPAPAKSEVPPPPEQTIETAPSGETVKLSTLGLGDEFLLPGGAKYVVSQVNASTGKPSMGYKLTDPSGEAVVGAKELPIADQHLDLDVMPVVPKGEEKSVTPEVAAQVSPSSFDISQYQQSGEMTLSDVEPGTVVLTAKGIPALIKSHGSSGTVAIALHNGKKIKLKDPKKKHVVLTPKALAADPGTAEATVPKVGDKMIYTMPITGAPATQAPVTVKEAKPGDPFVTVELENGSNVIAMKHHLSWPEGADAKPLPAVDLDLGQVSKGDKIKLKHMQAGMQFHLADFDNEIFEVVTPTVGDQAAVVKWVKPDGSLSQKDAVLASPELEYVVYALPSDKMAPGPPPEDVSADDFPDVETAGTGWNPYLHHKSGTKKYAKLATMPVGAQFKDKNGTQWIVKAQTGEKTILSDGHLNYAAPSSAFGNPAAGTLFDGAPALATSKPEADLAAIEAKMKTSPSGETLADLAPGDYFKAMGGAPFKVVGPTEHGNVLVQNVQSGKTRVLKTSFSPSHVAFGVGVQEPSVTPVPSPAAQSVWHAAKFVADWKDADAQDAQPSIEALSGEQLETAISVAENTKGANKLLIALLKQQEKLDVGDMGSFPDIGAESDVENFAVGQKYTFKGEPFEVVDIAPGEVYGDPDLEVTVENLKTKAKHVIPITEDDLAGGRTMGAMVGKKFVHDMDGSHSVYAVSAGDTPGKVKITLESTEGVLAFNGKPVGEPGETFEFDADAKMDPSWKPVADAEVGPAPQMVGDLTWKKGDKFVSQGNAQVPDGTVLTAVANKATPGGGGHFDDPDGNEVTLFNGHHVVPQGGGPGESEATPAGSSKLSSLEKGTVFSFGEGGGFHYEVVDKTADGTVYFKSEQSGNVSTAGTPNSDYENDLDVFPVSDSGAQPKAVKAAELKVGDVWVQEPGDNPATMGFKVTDITGTHVHSESVTNNMGEPLKPGDKPGGSSGMPLSWEKPVYLASSGEAEGEGAGDEPPPLSGPVGEGQLMPTSKPLGEQGLKVGDWIGHDNAPFKITEVTPDGVTGVYTVPGTGKREAAQFPAHAKPLPSWKVWKADGPEAPGGEAVPGGFTVGDQVTFYSPSEGKALSGDVVGGSFGNVHVKVEGSDSSFHALQPEQLTVVPAGGEVDPETHIYSAGKPVFDADGKPIQKYGVAYLDGTQEVTALGSGSAPGTVYVQGLDGEKFAVDPANLHGEPTESGDLDAYINARVWEGDPPTYGDWVKYVADDGTEKVGQVDAWTQDANGDPVTFEVSTGDYVPFEDLIEPAEVPDTSVKKTSFGLLQPGETFTWSEGGELYQVKSIKGEGETATITWGKPGLAGTDYDDDAPLSKGTDVFSHGVPDDWGTDAEAWPAGTPLPKMGDWVVYKVPMGTGLGKVMATPGNGPQSAGPNEYTVWAPGWEQGANAEEVYVSTNDLVSPHTSGLDALEKDLADFPPKTTVPSPLNPYLHHKSGSAKYTQIGQVPAGTTIKGKGKQTFTVVGHIGDMTVFADADGKQFSVTGKAYVLPLASGDVQESSVIAFPQVTGGGRLRPAA